MGYQFIGAWKQESGRRNLESLPILPICAVWVEILNKLGLGISTYFADLRCLGRDSQEAAPEISTLFRDLRHLGRDFQQTAPGISTIFCRFAPFG